MGIIRTLWHLLWTVLKTKQFKVCLIFFIIQVGYFFIFTDLSIIQKKVLFDYTQAKIFHNFMPDYQISIDYDEDKKKHYPVDAAGYYEAMQTQYKSKLNRDLEMLKKDLYESFRFFVFGVGLYFFLQFILYRNLLGKYIKGAKLISVNRLIQVLKNEGRARFKIGPVPLPIERESDHVLYIGPEGCGKKIDMMRNIKTAIYNDFPCIIFDFNGDMLSHFYREHTDHIFNIADPRSINWQLPNDLKYDFDFDAVSTALIPLPDEENNEIILGAREIFSGVLRYCASTGKLTNKDIENTLLLTPGRLKYILSDSNLNPLIDNPKMINCLKEHTRFFKYIDHEKHTFSIAEWIDNPKGNIFLSGYGPMEDIAKPFHAVFLDMIARKTTLLSETQQRQFFFFLDDFETLQTIPSILQLLRGQAKRTSVWIAIKIVVLLLGKYDREYIISILDGLKTKLIFNTTDSIATDYMSKLIGEQERVIKAGDTLKDLNINGTTVKQLLVHPDDFGTMPKFNAFLKMAGHFATKIVIEKTGENEFEQVAKRLIVRDDLAIKLGTEPHPDSFRNLPETKQVEHHTKSKKLPVPITKNHVKKELPVSTSKDDVEDEFIQLDLKEI